MKIGVRTGGIAAITRGVAGTGMTTTTDAADGTRTAATGQSPLTTRRLTVKDGCLPWGTRKTDTIPPFRPLALTHARDRHKHRETSEERRQRKAARKAEKLADAALLLPEEARQAAAEVAFYSAQDNPFHDANLGDKFVWGKKREKERKMGLTPEEAAKRDRERAWESQVSNLLCCWPDANTHAALIDSPSVSPVPPTAQQEIERLNQRRAEREKEAALREQEQMQQMRFAESAQMAAWIDKEDDFHLEQAKKRAEIRVRERRAKPIDYLALNLKWSVPPLGPGDEGYDEKKALEEEEEDDGAGLEVDLEEPYAIFDVRCHPRPSNPGPFVCADPVMRRRSQHLALEDAEELHDDIKMYLSLEKVEAHQDFWRALLIVSSAALEALREERSIGISAYQAQTRANAAVKAEITRLLSGKTHDQLVQLQGQVQAKLASGEVIDVDYWEGLLKELVVQKAKAKLRDMHEVVLNNRLEQLRKKQRDEALRYAQEVKNAIHVPITRDEDDDDDDNEQGDEDMEVEDEDAEADARPGVVSEAWDDKWEPTLHKKIPEECRQCQVVDFAEDRKKLVGVRSLPPSVAGFVPFVETADADCGLLRVPQYAARRAVAQARFVVKPRAAPTAGAGEGGAAGASNKDEEIYQAAVGQGFDDEEEFFNMEAEMSRQSYTWEDKYRPRKPRYFNKVHTGYEWNKYNQTHYEYVFVRLSTGPESGKPTDVTLGPAAPTTPRPRSSRVTSSTFSIPTSSTRPRRLVRAPVGSAVAQPELTSPARARPRRRIQDCQEQGEPRHLHDRVHCRPAVRGHRVHDRQSAVGAFAQARVPQLVRPRSAATPLFVPPQLLPE